MNKLKNGGSNPNNDQIAQLNNILFSQSIHALIFVDHDLNLLDVNPAFETLFHFDKKNLIGKSARAVFDAPFILAIQRWTQGLPHPEATDLVILDGQHHQRMIGFTVMSMSDPKRLLIEFSDQTEARRIERAYYATQACQLAMLEAFSEQELMKTVTRVMVDIGRYSFVWIGFLRNDVKKTVIPIAYAGHEDGYLDHLEINLTDPQLYSGPSGQAMVHNQPSVCRNIAEDPAYAPWRDSALKRGFHSSIAIPLSYTGQSAIGVMNLYSGEVNAFDEQEVRLLVQMTSSITFGIMMRRIQKGLNQSAYELDLTLKKMKRIVTQTVGALAATVEIRDPYTAGHQKRVTRLAVAIAREMGLADDKIDEITVAASLHDIGKVTVPSEILSKPGKISAIELEIIRTHPQAGYDIIKDVEFPWPVAEIVFQHHERIDGSGYPRGLKGHEILLAARIICVADVIEAMVSHRPYRPGLGQDAALNEIQTNRDILYDGIVVNACVSLFEQHRFNFEDQ